MPSERPPHSPADGRLSSGDRYLAIETSSARLSLAIGTESAILALHTGAHEWRHAESLFDAMEKLLRRARWSVQSLTGVAVSVGPGSFTGIRIGLAAARAFGQSLRIPVVGVSSLEIMAAGARTKAQWLSPQIDALRGQIFTGLYERTAAGAPRRVLPETMVFPLEWKRVLAKRSKREPVWISPLQGCYPEAGVLLEIARPRLLRARPDSYRSVLPLYIRKAAAQERKVL